MIAPITVSVRSPATINNALPFNRVATGSITRNGDTAAPTVAMSIYRAGAN
jgi:hypothetical protein